MALDPVRDPVAAPKGLPAPSAPKGRRSRGFNPQTWVFAGIVCLVAYLVLTPMVFLAYQSFRTPSTPTRVSEWTLGNYARILTDSYTLSLMGDTLLFAVGSALFALVIGTTLAWVNERTNTPFKNLLFALSLVPMIMPGILFTISWVLLLSPKTGLINRFLMATFGLAEPVFNAYSMSTMIWVEGLNLSPLVFLLVASTFRSMDPALEESAFMSGAGTGETIRHITLPLAAPAIFGVLLIALIRGLEAFEVPALLGMPAGIYTFTTEIYRSLRRYPIDLGLASAYAVLLLTLTTTGIFANARLTKEQSRFSTITGKGYRPRTIDLRGWRYVAAVLCLAYFFLVVFLPFLVLLWLSTQPYVASPSLEALGRASLANYQYIADQPTIVSAIWNSLKLGLGAATLIMLITAIISWMTIKTNIRYRWLLDNLASLPIVFPGLVLGVALMIVYLNIPIPIYGTSWLLLIAFVTLWLPYGMRYNSAAMLQIHRELEESAQVSGATWWQMFKYITLPLLKPGLVAGFVAILMISFRALSIAVMLYRPGAEVVSISIFQLWLSGRDVELTAMGVIMVVFLLVLTMTTRKLGQHFGVRD